MNIDLTIFGEPVSQPRQRHAMIGGHIRNYTPAKAPVNAYKYAIQCEAQKFFSGTPTTHPIKLAIICVFRRPKNHYRTGKNSSVLKADAPFWHTAKPDAENVAKAIMDALTGIAYRDDKQVADLRISKWYEDVHNQPQTRISFYYEDKL